MRRRYLPVAIVLILFLFACAGGPDETADIPAAPEASAPAPAPADTVVDIPIEQSAINEPAATETPATESTVAEKKESTANKTIKVTDNAGDTGFVESDSSEKLQPVGIVDVTDLAGKEDSDEIPVVKGLPEIGTAVSETDNIEPDTVETLIIPKKEDTVQELEIVPLNPLLTIDIPLQVPDDESVNESDGRESSTIPASPVSPVLPAAREVQENPVVLDDQDSDSAGQAVTSDQNESSVSVAILKNEDLPEQDFINPAEIAASPSRWLGGPGEFSVLLEGPGWVFRSDQSTPGNWRFLSRSTENESTRFSFLFEEQGDWNLVFERQDMSSGGSERAIRNVRVGDESGPIVENGPLTRESGASISGNMPNDPFERIEAARVASEAGRSSEALSYLEKDAERNDEAGRVARAAIISEAASTGAIAPLITWLPRYIEDGADSDVLAQALEILDHQVGYGDTEALIVKDLTRNMNDPRRPEWLYRLARLLEEPGDSRNLDRSAALYQQVVDGWPLTKWRDLSEERLIWLRRHYFRVR